MATNYLNFKKLEVTADNKKEAYAQAPFTITRDVTPSFNKWKESKRGLITDMDIKEFCVEKLEEITKSAPGSGLSITLQSAIKNTNKRPYVYQNIKNEEGTREWVTVHEIVDTATGNVIKTVEGPRPEAAKIIKDLICSKNYKGNYEIRVGKICKGNNRVVAKISYHPSTKSRPGSYILFGIEN